MHISRVSGSEWMYWFIWKGWPYGKKYQYDMRERSLGTFQNVLIISVQLSTNEQCNASGPMAWLHEFSNQPPFVYREAKNPYQMVWWLYYKRTRQFTFRIQQGISKGFQGDDWLSKEDFTKFCHKFAAMVLYNGRHKRSEPFRNRAQAMLSIGTCFAWKNLVFPPEATD